MQKTSRLVICFLAFQLVVRTTFRLEVGTRESLSSLWTLGSDGLLSVYCVNSNQEIWREQIVLVEMLQSLSLI